MGKIHEYRDARLKREELWYATALTASIEEARQPFQDSTEESWKTLSHAQQQHLSECLYWYAWHFDTYLNAACRGRVLVHVKQDLLNIEQGKQGDFESRFSIHNPSCSKDRIRPNPLQEDYFYKTRVEKERNERMAHGETTEEGLDKMKWDEHSIPLDRWVQEYKQDVERIIQHMY